MTHNWEVTIMSKPAKRASAGQGAGPKPSHVPERGPGHHIKPIVRAKDSKTTLKRLWKYLAGSKWLLGFVIFLVLLSVGSSLAGPYLMGRAIDALFEASPLTELARFAGLMILVYTVSAPGHRPT